MRILFISGANGPDYQCDMLFHGLRELLGCEVVDARRLWYMYASDLTPDLTRSLYGRGFTVYGRLPDALIDRTDIRAKIQSRHFDLIVYGSAWRNLDYLPLVRDIYPTSQIAFVDGEDEQTIRHDLLGAGLYFKRECTRGSHACIPINFAIPKSVIRTSVPAKTKPLATVVPGRPETYIFTEENIYYEDYATSMVAITTKKAGWDCLRHYEIMANGCVPYFPNLQACPSHTMTSLPKRFLRRALGWPQDPTRITADTYEACRRYASRYLTTETLATEFLDAVRSGKRGVPRREFNP